MSKKKKIKNQNFIVSWKIYPFDVMVSLGESSSVLIKKIEKKWHKLDDKEKEKLEMMSSAMARTVMLNNGTTILHFKSNDPATAVIAHEVFHAVTFLMERVGMKLSNDSDEAYAYAIQYLTDEIIGKLI